MCLWQHEKKNPFNFLRVTSQQLSTAIDLPQQQNIFVTSDSSEDQYGHFLWTSPEYTDSKFINKSTTIFSETIFGKRYNDTCFSFKYILSGDQNARINIYIKKNTIPKYRPKSFELTLYGNSSASNKIWNRVFAPFKAVKDNFEIYVEAIQGSKGVLAIDDLFFHYKKCTDVLADENELNQKFRCKDGNLISSEKVCNFIRDCVDGDDEKECAS